MNLQPLQTLIKNLEAFDAHKEVLEIVDNNREQLTNKQTDQLAHGVDVFGDLRTDEYRPLTKYLKRMNGVGLGAVTDRVTFYMTGKLYQSMFTQVVGEFYEAKSSLHTYDKMIDRIGRENFGLDYDSRLEFANETMMPEFKVVFKQKTGLTI